MSSTRTQRPRGRVVAIVQARMGSTRLPGKVLAEVNGRPLLWHIIRRVRAARLVDEVVVATSDRTDDDAVARYCEQHGIAVFRGSHLDVLDRFYHAARCFTAETVVRIAGDCPLIDPQVIDHVIQTFSEGKYDYVANILRYTYPDGLDTEVLSFAALETAWREARYPVEREHVTPYIRTSGRFRLANVENERPLPVGSLRWTVDGPADLEFVRAIYRRLGEGDPPFGFTDVLRLLVEEPELMTINAGTIRNEGYYRSLAAEPQVPPRIRDLTASRSLIAKAQGLIPSCTQTFSKGLTQFVQGVAPAFLVRGQGSHVWDADGNEYIDYPMALGPVILGHDYPAVTEAVVRQARKGVAFSLAHPLEIEVAEILVEVIPCAERVRYGKNGSDVTSGAVRVARAYTGRDIVACCGYHGWQDWYIGTTTRNRGVPDAVRRLTIPFEYNNIASLELIFAEHPDQVAAVILEPMGVVEPRDGFLEHVRDLTRANGAVLIFDEIITGFRLALGGAQEYFGVSPDVACFGKAIANGYPLSAIIGRREIMQLFDEVFFSFTFGGEALSLAAAKATLTEMRENNVIGHLWEQGGRLKDGYNVLANAFRVEKYTQCVGLPPRTVITFQDESGTESLILKSLFQQECLKRGILFSGGQNICYSHSDADVEYTLRVYRTAMEAMADAICTGTVAARLEGRPVEPVFRRA